MNGRRDNTRPGVATRPLFAAPFLVILALLIAAVSACGGVDDPTASPGGDDSTASPALDSEPTETTGDFASVSAGGGHTCGVRQDGSVACWGDDESGAATPPEGKFTSISAGSSHTCGVQQDSSVACWGWDDDGQATPPAGGFASVSAATFHTCGVRMDGTATGSLLGRVGRGSDLPALLCFVQV